MNEKKKPDASWPQLKLDLWVNNSERNGTHTVGTFGWVWLEGAALRAGPGPEFGNNDNNGIVAALMRDGLWFSVGPDGKPEGTGYTDFDVQPADPKVEGGRPEREVTS